jgi:outer membrane protein TolC
MNKSRNYLLTAILLLTTIAGVSAQEKISLEDCYGLARANYPAIKKMDLIAKTSQFTLENANKANLPQVSFSGQASYQSETISFPSALGTSGNLGILPAISKDQYKIQGEVDQQLYDGGTTRYQKDLIKADAELQKQNLEANLYAIDDRINNIFFAVLLTDAQLKQNELNKSDLQTQVQKTQAAFNNGVAYKSNVDELNAEITNINMASTEYTANRAAYLRMLSLFIGKEVSTSAQLVMPESITYAGEINRPELKAYDQQKAVYRAQENQLKAGYLPKFSAFFQGAYGRPTPNVIVNKFGPWYITGIKLDWSLGGLYTLANQKKILGFDQLSVDADKETFLLNTKMDITQQDEEVKKYTELIRQDDRAITLRQSVTRSASAQLDNGVITTHEYIQQVNAENFAQQNLILHRIQLLQAQYNQKFKSGN